MNKPTFQFVGRLIALFLSLCLALPTPAFALREKNIKEKNPTTLGGLEEALLSNNPQRIGNAFRQLAQAAGIVPPPKPASPMPVSAPKVSSPFPRVGLEEGVKSFTEAEAFIREAYETGKATHVAYYNGKSGELYHPALAIVNELEAKGLDRSSALLRRLKDIAFLSPDQVSVRLTTSPVKTSVISGIIQVSPIRPAADLSQTLPTAGLEEARRLITRLNGLIREAIQLKRERDPLTLKLTLDRKEYRRLVHEADEVIRRLMQILPESAPRHLLDRYIQVLVSLIVTFPFDYWPDSKSPGGFSPEGVPFLSWFELNWQLKAYRRKPASERDRIRDQMTRHLIAYKTRFGDQSLFDVGGAKVVQPWKNLKQLWEAQKAAEGAGANEMSFSIFSPLKKSSHPLIVYAMELELPDLAIIRFHHIAPFNVHTHGFSLPLEASEKDTQSARDLYPFGVRHFILAFDRSDWRLTELAWFNPRNGWRYVKDPEVVEKKLQSIGLLVYTVGLEETTDLSLAAGGSQQRGQVQDTIRRLQSAYPPDREIAAYRITTWFSRSGRHPNFVRALAGQADFVVERLVHHSRYSGKARKQYFEKALAALASDRRFHPALKAHGVDPASLLNSRTGLEELSPRAKKLDEELKKAAREAPELEWLRTFLQEEGITIEDPSIRFAVHLGANVLGSSSPPALTYLYNRIPEARALFEKAGIRLISIPRNTPEGELPDLLQAIEEHPGVVLVTATQPHKIKVGEWVSRWDPQEMPATNVLILRDAQGKLVGARGMNSDGPGFVEQYKRGWAAHDGREGTVEGKIVAISGGWGGLGQALAISLLKEKPSKLIVSEIDLPDRPFEQAQREFEEAVARLSQQMGVTLNAKIFRANDPADPSKDNPEFIQEARGANVVINATGLGMEKEDNRSPFRDPNVFNPQQEVFDPIYRTKKGDPRPVTPFIQQAWDAGAREVFNGVGLYVRGFALEAEWLVRELTGQTIDRDAIYAQMYRWATEVRGLKEAKAALTAGLEENEYPASAEGQSEGDPNIALLREVHERAYQRIRQERPDLWDEEFGRYLYSITNPKTTFDTLQRLRKKGYLQGAKSAADLGSGQGAVVDTVNAATQQEQITVTGFEIDPALMKEAQALMQQLSGQGLVDPKRVRWRETSYLEGDVDLREFDLLFLNPSIEGVKVEPEVAFGLIPMELLDKIIQRMKPGALLIFGSPETRLPGPQFKKRNDLEYLPDIDAFRRIGPSYEETLERQLEAAWPKIEAHWESQDYNDLLQDLQELPDIPKAYRTSETEDLLRKILPIQSEIVILLARPYMARLDEIPEEAKRDQVKVAALLTAPLLIHRDLLVPDEELEKRLKGVLMLGMLFWSHEQSIPKEVAEKYVIDPALGLPERAVNIILSNMATRELWHSAEKLRDSPEGFSVSHPLIKWPIVKALAHFVIQLTSEPTGIWQEDFDQDLFAGFIGFVGAYYGIKGFNEPLGVQRARYDRPLSEVLKELHLGPVPPEIIQAIKREDKAALFNLAAIGARILAAVADRLGDANQLHEWSNKYAQDALRFKHHSFLRPDLFPNQGERASGAAESSAGLEERQPSGGGVVPEVSVPAGESRRSFLARLAVISGAQLFQGYFRTDREGRPTAELFDDPQVGSALNTQEGEGLSLKLDLIESTVNPAATPSLLQLIVQEGAVVPARWEQVARLTLSADRKKAQEQLKEYVEKGLVQKGSMALMAPSAEEAFGAWDSLLQEYKVTGLLLTRNALLNIQRLGPDALETFLANLKAVPGLVKITGVVEKRIQNERKLFIYA